MHDIDRTLTEFDPEMEAFGSDEFEYDQSESSDTETGVFDEAEEMELAAELLSVSDEAELDQFIGRLIKRAGSAVGRFVKSPAGSALRGYLKGAVRKALPTLTGALGTAIGGPAGAAIAGQLSSTAGRVFGLELEGLSPEDQEFELARRFVRFGGEAAKHAATTLAEVDPQTSAKTATVEAAKTHAPGLLRPAPGTLMSAYGPRRSGRWLRRGRKIILLGA